MFIDNHCYLLYAISASKQTHVYYTTIDNGKITRTGMISRHVNATMHNHNIIQGMTIVPSMVRV